jgi:hypothetical protein
MASQQVSGFVDLTSNQTIGGIKTFSSPPVIADKVTLQSSQSITGTGTGTFSFGLGENVFVLNSTITTVTLPTPATANIGASFFIIKGNSTAEWSLAIVCGASQTMFVNGDGAATSYTMEIDETSIRVTCVAAVSGTVWNLHDNFKRRVQSFATNALYPVSPSWAYPSNITTINSIAIGYGSFSNSTSGSRNNNTVSIGFNCLNQINNASAINNVCIGTQVLASTGTNNVSNNTCIGFQSGYGFGQSGSRNTLIGATTNFNAASAFSDSTALGYGATITASNQIMIGRTSENVVMPGTALVLNQYVHSGYGLITANATISAPYFEIYAIATPSATAISLTLPTPVVGLVGLKLTFRRVNANAAQVNSSQGYYPFTSNTVTSTILLTAVATTQVGNQISIVCLPNSATPTYGWFQTQ